MPLLLATLSVASLAAQTPAQGPLRGLDDVQIVLGTSHNPACLFDDVALRQRTISGLEDLDVSVARNRGPVPRPVATRFILRVEARVAPNGTCMAILSTQLTFEAAVAVPYQPASRTHELPVLLWEAMEFTRFASVELLQSQLEASLGVMFVQLERAMR